jgi:hypothetical protein
MEGESGTTSRAVWTAWSAPQEQHAWTSAQAAAAPPAVWLHAAQETVWARATSSLRACSFTLTKSLTEAQLVQLLPCVGQRVAATLHELLQVTGGHTTRDSNAPSSQHVLPCQPYCE